MPGKDQTEIAEPHPADAEAADEAAKQPAGSEPSAKSEISDSDAADAEAADEAAEQTAAAEPQRKSTRATNGHRVSVSVRTLVVATSIVALLALAGVTTWLYIDEKAKFDAQGRQAANNAHAEQIALDYAVGAAKIDFQDLGPWKKNLVEKTTAELKEKLSSAATSMEQILVPLQWKSTAVPLVAKVRSHTNGIYVVDTFVGVETKTMQAPEGLQSTATYSITIDSNHDWQISDVGGIGTVLGQK
ncbi:MAG: Mce-associated rane protein [Mycobacterium sp.]|jgi:type II secretory pathway pseudopilin PulG|nr:Mce-associated rane protein [Mycobacterium sp.]